jgi:hypothetical protein
VLKEGHLVLVIDERKQADTLMEDLMPSVRELTTAAALIHQERQQAAATGPSQGVQVKSGEEI